VAATTAWMQEVERIRRQSRGWRERRVDDGHGVQVSRLHGRK